MRRLALLVVLLAPACRISLEQDYVPPPDAPISASCQAAKDEVLPTAAFLETTVFKVGCTSMSCHDNDQPEDNQDLTAGHAWMSTVNFDSLEEPGYKVVVAGEPHKSYLMMRIHQFTGAEMDPPLPDPAAADQDDFYMPQRASDLCKEKRDAIQRWIEGGAPM